MLLLWDAQALDNPLSQSFVDLAMARNGLRFTRVRIPIPIVIPTMANQDAAGVLQLLDQVPSLHET